MPVKNNLKHWRHQCQMERADFASFLQVGYFHYTRWERQVTQPNAESLLKIRDRLKERFPDIALDDLIYLE